MRPFLFVALTGLVCAASNVTYWGAPRLSLEKTLPNIDSSGHPLAQAALDVDKPSCGETSGTANARSIGYYQVWNMRTRPCDRMSPSQLNTTGLTHVILAFASIDTKSFKIRLENDNDKDVYHQFIELKDRGLGTWLGVGGWEFNDEGETRTTWSDMVADQTNRKAFISSSLSMLEEYGFQGLDLDWEWPAATNRGGRSKDTANYVQFVKELRKALGSSYGLSCVLPQDAFYLSGVDVKSLAPHVDWFNVLTYDLHGAWDAKASGQGQNIRPHTDLKEIDDHLNALWVIGVEPKKFTLGLAYYGRGYTASDPKCLYYGCGFTGPSYMGSCTKQDGVMSNTEIKRLIKEKGLTPSIITGGASAMQVSWDNQWMGFDDANTMALKKAFANDRCMGGTAIWALDYDSSDNGDANPPPPRSSSAASRVPTSSTGTFPLSPPTGTVSTRPTTKSSIPSSGFFSSSVATSGVKGSTSGNSSGKTDLPLPSSNARPSKSSLSHDSSTTVISVTSEQSTRPGSTSASISDSTVIAPPPPSVPTRQSKTVRSSASSHHSKASPTGPTSESTSEHKPSMGSSISSQDSSAVKGSSPVASSGRSIHSSALFTSSSDSTWAIVPLPSSTISRTTSKASSHTGMRSSSAGRSLTSKTIHSQPSKPPISVSSSIVPILTSSKISETTPKSPAEPSTTSKSVIESHTKSSKAGGSSKFFSLPTGSKSLSTLGGSASHGSATTGHGEPMPSATSSRRPTSDKPKPPTTTTDPGNNPDQPSACKCKGCPPSPKPTDCNCKNWTKPKLFGCGCGWSGLSFGPGCPNPKLPELHGFDCGLFGCDPCPFFGGCPDIECGIIGCGGHCFGGLCDPNCPPEICKGSKCKKKGGCGPKPGPPKPPSPPKPPKPPHNPTKPPHNPTNPPTNPPNDPTNPPDDPSNPPANPTNLPIDPTNRPTNCEDKDKTTVTEVFSSCTDYNPASVGPSGTVSSSCTELFAATLTGCPPLRGLTSTTREGSSRCTAAPLLLNDDEGDNDSIPANATIISAPTISFRPSATFKPSVTPKSFLSKTVQKSKTATHKPKSTDKPIGEGGMWKIKIHQTIEHDNAHTYWTLVDSNGHEAGKGDSSPIRSINRPDKDALPFTVDFTVESDTDTDHNRVDFTLNADLPFDCKVQWKTEQTGPGGVGAEKHTCDKQGYSKDDIGCEDLKSGDRQWKHWKGGNERFFSCWFKYLGHAGDKGREDGAGNIVHAQ